MAVIRGLAVIAAQAPGNVFGCIVKGGMGIRRLAFTAQGQAARGVQVDVTGKKRTCAAEGNAGLHGLPEILFRNAVQMGAYPVFQGIGQVDLLSGNTDVHKG